MMAIGILGLAAFVALLAVATRANRRRLDTLIRSCAETSMCDDADLLPALRDDVTPVIRIPSAPPLPVYQAERCTPAGTATVETGFVVPALQALGTATAVTLACGVLAWAAGWTWRVPAVAFALGLAGGWFWRLGLADRLLHVVETITRTDIDGDGAIGTPQRAFTVANPAQARAAADRSAREQEQASQRAALLAFVDRCFTSGTSESAQGVDAGARGDYVKMRDALLSLGVACWKNPNRPKSGWLMAVDREQARDIVAKHVL